MDLKSSIGHRLKEIRGSKSQAEFAKALKVSQGTVGRYERGLRSPDADYIVLLSKNFNINPNWLLTGEGSKYFIPNGLMQEAQIQKKDKPKVSGSDFKKITLEHLELIKRFKNPKVGLNANKWLIDLQDSDEYLFDKAIKSLKKLRDAAMITREVSTEDGLEERVASDPCNSEEKIKKTS